MRRFTAIFIALFVLFGFSSGAMAAPKERHSATRFYAPASYAKAANVIRLAHRGDRRAQAYLGFMYQTGKGVPENYELAAYWYGMAAERGDGNAQFALGLMYNKGQGVKADFVQAHKWLNLSAAQAKGEDRDFKVRIRNSIETKMSVAQVQTAQQLARDWSRMR